ncbi:hypothetical protein RIF29_26988 [Crotalaria pallida]|uniref:Uncharacterized protein n=1 Tax=Crotalaria pallida TaxID=3830 RepID=A0AAN9ET95_CROPI
MSTWQILSGAGNNYRWQQISQHVNPKQNDDEASSNAIVIPIPISSPLPSMADLLLQACSSNSTINEEEEAEAATATVMFRTGLGKPVRPSQSSINKALSLFGEDANAHGEVCAIDNISSSSNSLFKTGSGKRVTISSNGLVRAKTLLGLKEDTVVSNIQSPRHGTNLHTIGEDADAAAQGEEHATDSICSFSNSLFMTGSGKRVTISSNGLVRAKTLLGLKEDTVGSNIQSPQHAKKLHGIGETYERQHSPNLQLHKSVNSNRMMNTISCQSLKVGGSHTLKNDVGIEVFQPDVYTSDGKQAPIKFHTAGGRSISVSNDALQRARSLLGDPDLGDFFDGGDVGDSIFSLPNERQTNSGSSCDRNDCDTPVVHQLASESNHVTKCFTLPSSTSGQKHTKFLCEGTANNLIKKFDAVGNDNGYSMKSSITRGQKQLHDRIQVPESAAYGSSLNGFSAKIDPLRMSSGRPLADISNTINTVHTNNRQPAGGKRRLGPRVTVSPFKKPRSSNISVPSDQDLGVFPNGFFQLSGGSSGSKRKVSTLYPFQHPRMCIEDFFSVPSLDQKVHFPNQVRQVTSANAEKYIFHEVSGEGGMGAEAFVNLLVQHGASTHFASKEWVLNHYKWIVWKLACYGRYYSARSPGNFLTVSNVLEELKYRYEREVNHGHRSTLKKILEGDALPSSMMILCISSIHSNHGPENGTFSETWSGTQSSEPVIVELTDGWYSMNAILDVPLSKQLASGKLFVGQKLRIWGAGLCGWDGPVSPLEVPSTVSLLLHINGTYRAHWAERLGFCKIVGPPLAFRCIKSNGGLIPQTLAGITRIYPILYKERLSNGRSVVISERMQNKMTELHNQRHSAVVEGVILEYQKERRGSCMNDDSDSEGAKIYNMLEAAAEPEFLMADMSAEQLSSFAAYKAKLNATRHSEMEKSIEKALKDAGLRNREVTPFMRLRVVGLTHKTRQDKPKEGIVTIWSPTEKQREELVEGVAYAIAGLIPSGVELDILHLQTRGSSTKWLPLSSNAREQFKPFFSNRKSISMSSLSDIPLSSEFDIAAHVVHVGEVYTSSQQKKQWVFVTDGSIMHGLHTENFINSLLAICFCSPSIDYDSFPPINYNLAGSTVGFCNLVKKEKDHANHIWVADATENSTYSLCFDSPHYSHLRNDASSIRRWANNSSLAIEKLKEKVLSVVGDSKG